MPIKDFYQFSLHSHEKSDCRKSRIILTALPIKRKLEVIRGVENLPPDKKEKNVAAECCILKSKESLQNNYALQHKKSRKLEGSEYSMVSIVCSG